MAIVDLMKHYLKPLTILDHSISELAFQDSDIAIFRDSEIPGFIPTQSRVHKSLFNNIVKVKSVMSRVERILNCTQNDDSPA